MDHIVSQAEWRRTFTDDIGERFTPFMLARADLYSVTNFQDVDGMTGRTDTFTRQMIGGGLDYRYPFVSHTDNASQVIEPVVQIIARGGGSNKNVPNEDFAKPRFRRYPLVRHQQILRLRPDRKRYENQFRSCSTPTKCIMALA